MLRAELGWASTGLMSKPNSNFSPKILDIWVRALGLGHMGKLGEIERQGIGPGARFMTRVILS